MKGLEIERKFLISKLSDNLDIYHHYEIEQGYFVLGKNIEERVCHRGDNFYYTKKVGHGKIREEYENEITKEEFDSIWPKTEGKRIHKTRYVIPYKNHNIELDIYHDKLEGQIVSEVEFNDEEESKSSVLPERFGEEITSDDKYKNKNLAFYGFDQLKST